MLAYAIAISATYCHQLPPFRRPQVFAESYHYALPLLLRAAITLAEEIYY